MMLHSVRGDVPHRDGVILLSRNGGVTLLSTRGGVALLSVRADVIFLSTGVMLNSCMQKDALHTVAHGKLLTLCDAD